MSGMTSDRIGIRLPCGKSKISAIRPMDFGGVGVDGGVGDDGAGLVVGAGGTWVGCGVGGDGGGERPTS